MKTGPIFAAAACALLAACRSTHGIKAEGKPVAASMGAADVAQADWVKTELYFDFAPAEAEGLGLAAAEGTWRLFIDEEVAPRFPDGVVVFDASGQRRPDEKGGVDRMRTRVLVIVHPGTPDKRAAIEALREAYKKRTGDKRVLKIETPIPAPSI